MALLDRNHPFFQPMWRRVATVAVPIIWAGVEMASGAPGWAILFFAAGAWAGWELFLAPAKDTPDPGADKSQPQENGED